MDCKTFQSGGFAELMACTEKPARLSALPVDSAARKEVPLWEGTFGYAPAALAAMARASYKGLKHTPGEPMHHARWVSADYTNAHARHVVDFQALEAEARRGAGWTKELADAGEEELGYLVWRVAMYAQTKLEEMGRAPLAPRARATPADPLPEPTAQATPPLRACPGLLVGHGAACGKPTRRTYCVECEAELRSEPEAYK